MRMIPQHFDSTLRELNWGAEDERQTLLVVRIVVIHVEYTGAVIATLSFKNRRSRTRSPSKVITQEPENSCPRSGIAVLLENSWRIGGRSATRAAAAHQSCWSWSLPEDCSLRKKLGLFLPSNGRVDLLQG